LKRLDGFSKREPNFEKEKANGAASNAESVSAGGSAGCPSAQSGAR
jgi:hypothetical protein